MYNRGTQTTELKKIVDARIDNIERKLENIIYINAETQKTYNIVAKIPKEMKKSSN